MKQIILTDGSNTNPDLESFLNNIVWVVDPQVMAHIAIHLISCGFDCFKVFIRLMHFDKMVNTFPDCLLAGADGLLDFSFHTDRFYLSLKKVESKVK